MPGDYDGDGTVDLAVFEPSTAKWHILGSTTGYFFRVFGNSEMTPVPGDYDADGTTDCAMFEANKATWHVLGSTSSYFSRVYGNNKMTPLADIYEEPILPPQHLPILTGGGGFLFKDDTTLVLLPSYYAGKVSRVVFANDPEGKDVFFNLYYTGSFGGRLKYRWTELKGKLGGRSFYTVVFFKAGGLPQPYLIFNGGSRQE